MSYYQENPEKNNYKKQEKPGKEVRTRNIRFLYWLNLDRSPDRRIHMENVLKDPIFDTMQKTRIMAIDGKTDDLEKYMKIDKPRMLSTEYGCTLSHLEAIRQFAQSSTLSDDSLSWALILEDDICLDFKPYWEKTLTEIIKEAPQDWEIIQLSYIITEYEPKELYEHHTPKKNLCSTAAYIISNKAAKRIILEIYKNGKFHLPNNINHQADIFLFFYFKTYTYKYCPFIYRTVNDSLIHPDHVEYHTKNKEKIEKMLKMHTNNIYKDKYWSSNEIQDAIAENKYLFMMVGIIGIGLFYSKRLKSQ